MLIRMRTLSRGPESKDCWNPGEIKSFSEEEAELFMKAGIAEKIIEEKKPKAEEKKEKVAPESTAIEPEENAMMPPPRKRRRPKDEKDMQ